MAFFDDDGQRIVDESCQPLIPFDPQLEYDETSATFLSAWAGSYRDVRGKLQATRKGRDQKVVRVPKPGGKAASK
eukprot:11949158-Karenia_brevis.AAC.1